MFNLILSYHYQKPEILDDKTFKYQEMQLKASIAAHGFYTIFHSENRNSCIEAWNNIQIACDKQLKYFNLN